MISDSKVALPEAFVQEGPGYRREGSKECLSLSFHSSTVGIFLLNFEQGIALLVVPAHPAQAHW